MRRILILGTLIAVSVVAGACREDGAVEVHRLSFSGVESIDEARLRGALATRQSSRLPWGRKYYFDRTRFDADLKRIQAFYTDRGFPDARVQAFDVNLNDEQDAVDISVTVSEGEPVRVAAVEFIGFDDVPPEHLDELKRDIPLEVGEPRDRQLVLASQEMAANELRDHGYPYAKVTASEEPVPPAQVGVTLAANTGPLAHFGTVEINGQTSVSIGVIRRQLGFRTGDLYSRSVVQESQRRLYAMELFQFVNIEAVDPELQDPIVKMRVTVAEGNHQQVKFGVGYGTEEKARVDAEYTHVNFLGAARSAGVHARWSSLDRGIRLTFNQPYLFRPGMTLGVEGQRWYTFTPAYQSVVTGAKATVTHRWGTTTSVAVSVIDERNSSTVDPEVLADPELRNDLIALGLDPTTGAQEGTLAGLAFDAQRSTADNLLDARRGYQLAFHAESAGGLFPGTFNYTSMSADGRHYLPMGPVVIANRLQVGNIRPASADPTNVPFSKKFFLGGSTSIRGWGRYEVSPLSEGLPIGGNTMVAFTSELRAPIRGKLSGVIFMDGGNVWTDSWSIRLDDLRYAIGSGLRYQTPVGPIRVDVGYQLNPIEGLVTGGAGSPENPRRWRIHFSIGQAF
jgi:outer membrane protein assembly complex protein YaeT